VSLLTLRSLRLARNHPSADAAVAVSRSEPGCEWSAERCRGGIFGILSGSPLLGIQRATAVSAGWRAAQANQFALRSLAHLTRGLKSVRLGGYRQKLFADEHCSLTSDVS
jgi:hypothetical protein